MGPRDGVECCRRETSLAPAWIRNPDGPERSPVAVPTELWYQTVWSASIKLSWAGLSEQNFQGQQMWIVDWIRTGVLQVLDHNSSPLYIFPKISNVLVNSVALLFRTREVPGSMAPFLDHGYCSPRILQFVTISHCVVRGIYVQCLIGTN